MAAPAVAEARLTITAPFCAAVVETVGACVVLPPPPPPLFPPPHPIIKAFDSRIAVSIVAAAHIAKLRCGEKSVRTHPRWSLFNYPRFSASNLRAAGPKSQSYCSAVALNVPRNGPSFFIPELRLVQLLCH